MLLRRMMDHVKHQNWLAVFLDFVIVVVGILIAFQITQWNEDRRERERETYVLQRLVEEIRTIKENALRNQNAFEHRSEVAGRVLDFMQSDQSVPEDPSALMNDLSVILFRRAPAQRAPTIVELMSSGELGIIQDNTLREELIHFDQVMQDALGSDALQIDFWVNKGAPFMSNLILDDHLGQDWEDTSYSVGFYDIDALRKDTSQLSAISWIRRMHIVATNTNTFLLQHADEALETLEKHAGEQQP